MLDVLMRSIGLDPSRVKEMMDNATQEYESRIAHFNSRFDALEQLLGLVVTKLESIENGRSNAGVGATQQQYATAADAIGAAEFIEPGNGVLTPLHPGAGIVGVVPGINDGSAIGGPTDATDSGAGESDVHGDGGTPASD